MNFLSDLSVINLIKIGHYCFWKDVKLLLTEEKCFALRIVMGKATVKTLDER